MTTVDFSGTRDLRAKFATWRGGFDTSDGRALIATIETVVRDGNRAGLLSGLDKYGRPMPAVRNPDNPRRGGGGPALIPQEESADLITRYQTSHYFDGTDRAVVLAGWTGIPWLKYHAPGPDHNPKLPERDVIGIRPETRQRVRDAVRLFVSGKFNVRANAAASREFTFSATT